MTRYLIVMLTTLTLSAGAQTFTVPKDARGFYYPAFAVSHFHDKLTASDTSLGAFYVPQALYLRKAEVYAVTVEDTASFLLQGGTAFGTTLATVAVEAAGESYSIPSGGKLQLQAGTAVRWNTTLQDTLHRVTTVLWFTLDP